jgi:tetratricopeptide (TPR) repeat protein
MKQIKITILLLLAMTLFACGWGRSMTPVPEHLNAGTKQIQKGLRWYQKGCYDRALEHFLRAHELYSTSDVLDGVAMSLNNLGSVYQAMGDCERALLCLDEAYRIYVYSEKEAEAARTLNNKASTLIKMGRLDEAEGVLGKALGMVTKANNSKVQITILINQGVFLTKRGQYKEAEALLVDCLRTMEQDTLQSSASVYFALGNLMLETQRFEKAVAFFDKALESDRRAGFYKGIADDLYYMGLAFFKAEEGKDAIQRWKRSAKIYAMIGCVNDANNVMKYLKESSLKYGVDIGLTELFIKKWLRGESYERLCHD